MSRFSLILLATLALIGTASLRGAPKTATLDDLKKLPNISLIPKWLPDGYRLRSVTIDRDDREGLEDPKTPGFATYTLDYSNGKKGEFTVESARWGIGDRNLDADESAEESQFATERFGKVYTIFVPKGKSGVKKRITSNWIADANWRAEEAKAKGALHLLGRVHGVSGYGMTLGEFEKIVQSLRPIWES